MFELETEERYEIWGGEKLMMTPSSSEHSLITANLLILIGQYVKKNQLGKVFNSEVPIYLHGNLMNKDFRLADISFISIERVDIVQSKGIYGPPDLIVEVLSSGKSNIERDRVEKFQLYEKYGVQEYWIVQPYEEKVEIFSLENNRYIQIDQSRVLTGIELRKEDIFE
ncbi:Uma2 family endonuclease [Microaerobacter geothermalis]|uniref:Uma2 family endonuclease n=1 Tax=Microaerobacter geothermalis TaxID=674972 RepID=UPI001F2F77CC|nr:Uma2 family endonuclease [Microaerobacter geothermalis]MCF6094906.1 Uma2 family endonuclease [Microaerobacter geothermalis]